MKTKTEALKELYVKIGGKLTDTYPGIAGGKQVLLYDTISDLIEVCGKIAISAELPSVTSDDNGDVLSVVDGAWAKAEPGGGNSPMVVTCVKKSIGSRIVIDNISASYEDISEAVTNNVPVVLYVKEGAANKTFIYSMTGTLYNGGNARYCFDLPFVITTNHILEIDRIIIDDEGITYESYAYTLTPTT